MRATGHGASAKEKGGYRMITLVQRRPLRSADGALRQFTRLCPLLAAAGAGILLLVAGVYALSVYQGVEPWMLTGDPTALTDSRWWLGLLSNLGIMLWSAAAAVCALGTYLLFRADAGRWPTLFLLMSTGMRLALAIDDAFLLHEEVLPAHLGIPEKAVYSAYAAMTVAYVLVFGRMLVATEYVILLVSLACFAASIAIDLFTYAMFIEDALKFAGIVFWVLYFARTVAHLVEKGLVGARAAHSDVQRTPRVA
jgi:hypothetical protein